MGAVYRVTGALAVAKVCDSEQYLRRGSLVPAGVAAEQVEHLISVGLVSKVDVADEAAPVGAKGIDGMTVAELKEHAAARGIDLGEAGKKGEILAAIRASEA